MSEAEQTSLDALPTGPGVRILRAAKADAWRDGYRFLAEAAQTADQIKQSARDAYTAEHARGYAEGRLKASRRRHGL